MIPSSPFKWKPQTTLYSTVALGGHSLCLASSQQRIFASSWHWACRYFVGFRSIASSHLRNFGYPDFLKPSDYFGDSGDSCYLWMWLIYGIWWIQWFWWIWQFWWFWLNLVILILVKLGILVNLVNKLIRVIVVNLVNTLILLILVKQTIIFSLIKLCFSM
mgnify:CR=1 FL=1